MDSQSQTSQSDISSSQQSDTTSSSSSRDYEADTARQRPGTERGVDPFREGMGGHIVRESMAAEKQAEVEPKEPQEKKFFRWGMGGHIMSRNLAAERQSVQEDGSGGAPGDAPLTGIANAAGDDEDVTWWDGRVAAANDSDNNSGQRAGSRRSEESSSSCQTLVLGPPQMPLSDAALNNETHSLVSGHTSQTSGEPLGTHVPIDRYYGTWEQGHRPTWRSYRSNDTILWSRQTNARYRRAVERSRTDQRLGIVLLLLLLTVVILLFLVISR